MKTLYIIIAFCLGLLFGHLMFQNEQYVTSPTPGMVEQIQKKAFAIDSNKLLAQFFLRKRNLLLENQLEVSNALLSKSKKELTKQKNTLTGFALRIQADTALCKDVNLKDSLIAQINSLNTATDLVIDNYELKLIAISSIVAVRDSDLVICNQSYRDIKGLIEEQAFREQKLTSDLNTALKQQKHKRLENKILAVGLLFVSGVVASLIIKSTK